METKIGDPRFIVPLLLKGGEFSELPIEIHGKIAIPFKQDWHHGLAQLVERLEKDEVPRAVTPDTTYLAEWSRNFLDLDKGITRRSETLLSNEILLRDPLPQVRVFQAPLGFTQMQRLSRVWPSKSVGDHIVAFASSEDWSIDGENIPLRLRAEVPIGDFIRYGVTALANQTRGSRGAAIAEILRLAWERFATSRGLQPDRLANDKLCWFVPGIGSEAKLEPYVDALGNNGKRQLNGEHKAHTWHYAVQAIPKATEPLRFVLKAHVTFTEDGSIPIADVDLKHSLRRRVAKMWWQDKWRDLLSAFLSKVSDGAETMRLPLSPNENLLVSTHPATYPISVAPSVDDGVMEPDDEEQEDGDTVEATQ